VPLTISFVDLSAQYRNIGPEIEPVVREIMASGRFILGPELARFEGEFAAYCGVSSAVGVASGTDALHLALEALGLGPGDEVIVPVNTFIATAYAVNAVGAKPVFVDVDPRTYNISAAVVESALTPATRAIIPVHLYGQPVDMGPLTELALRHGLFVVEDACQAHGAEYRGKRTGSLGDVGCFSFYPGKNLGAYGDGGMIVTDNAEIVDRLRSLRDLGRKSKYEHTSLGYNSRLDNIQAAILLVKLRHLESWNAARRKWAGLYDQLLADAHCVCPYGAPFVTHVYHLYVIRAERRDELAKHLRDRGIDTGVHYPVPLHMQKVYDSLGYRVGQFPVAEKLSNEILSLPMYPELEEERVRDVARAVRSFTG
jgi:dTDP-4-amino-4,6-dideoxygalactose transaminase